MISQHPFCSFVFILTNLKGELSLRVGFGPLPFTRRHLTLVAYANERTRLTDEKSLFMISDTHSAAFSPWPFPRIVWKWCIVAIWSISLWESHLVIIVCATETRVEGKPQGRHGPDVKPINNLCTVCRGAESLDGLIWWKLGKSHVRKTWPCGS